MYSLVLDFSLVFTFFVRWPYQVFRIAANGFSPSFYLWGCFEVFMPEGSITLLFFFVSMYLPLHYNTVSVSAQVKSSLSTSQVKNLFASLESYKLREVCCAIYYFYYYSSRFTGFTRWNFIQITSGFSLSNPSLFIRIFAVLPICFCLLFFYSS